MSQKKAAQKQKTDQQPDFFQLYRQQHGNPQYMRFYMQQDSFTFHPFHIDNQNKMVIEHDKQLTINLPMNRIISSAVSDTLIMNRFIYNNSKIVNSLIQNGRQMILGNYIKKHFNWLTFLNRKQMALIKNAYINLSYEQQSIIQYSVLSISNLILKLGINISKLSCILTSKKNTTNFISIPTLSILFLQFLMYTLFQNKQISQKQAKSQFLRQLPRITYIKFSQILNRQQLLAMQIGQEFFFSKHSFVKIKNIQYLQFYQHQLFKLKKSGYERSTNYDYIRWVNLRKTYGIKAPFGYEIVFLFRNIYMNVIKDFNPDLIIFVQDYDSNKRVMEPQIRALLITQLMQNVTGKVFVMRQVGHKTPEQKIIQMTNPQLLTQYHSSMSSQFRADKEEKMGNQMVDQSQQMIRVTEQVVPLSSFPNFQQILFEKMSTWHIITEQVQRQLDKQEKSIINNYFNEHLTRTKQNPNFMYSTSMAKIQEILRDDISYIALALIQRNSFQSVATESHLHMYDLQFLQRVSSDISQYWLKDYVYTLGLSNQIKKQLKQKLQLSKTQVQQMIQNMKITQVSLFYKNSYNYIFDLRTNQTLYLNVISDGQMQKEIIQYFDKDHVHVYYGQSQLLVFIFRLEEFIILKLISSLDSLTKQFQYYFQKVIDWESFTEDMILRDSTYVITDKLIYKGFGVPLHNQSKQGSRIMRTNYRDLFTQKKNRSKLEKDVRKHDRKMPQFEGLRKIQAFSLELKNSSLLFRQLDPCILEKQNKKTQIPLIQKTCGWAVFDQTTKNTIFMGGYSRNCVNDNKINKLLHVCSETSTLIKATGKTSAQLFWGCKNTKAKIPLYPFIYGIVFVIEKTSYILNTNGFVQSFNNSNKLFLTEFKLSTEPIDTKYGIKSQRKLYVNYQDQNDRLYIVTAKQFLVHYIVNSYNINNSYQNRCFLQTLDEGQLILQLNPNDIINGKKTISLRMETNNQQYNGFKEIKIFFNPIDI